jgi:hypothetical protein
MAVAVPRMVQTSMARDHDPPILGNNYVKNSEEKFIAGSENHFANYSFSFYALIMPRSKRAKIGEVSASFLCNVY